MNSNTGQYGLSWHLWLKNHKNKALFESDQNEALKKFKMDEEEFIHNILLQERIELEKQRQIIIDQEKQANIQNKELLENSGRPTLFSLSSVASSAAASGAGGVGTPPLTVEAEILTETGEFLLTENNENLITE